ncbi:MAG: hypothetical protein KKA16_10380 [Alphaproteobacteria bacterium]|nr:hypothetical protein [Alphaproteobacteria bacterium]MBU2380496.1 hypothetical protein [Alphaproteobacteria bacterium]
MTGADKSTDERLRDLNAALEARRPKAGATAPTPVSPPVTVIGRKTGLALKIMTWTFRVFWAGWVIVALAAGLPGSVLQMVGVIIFSAVCCWLTFQCYKIALLSAVATAGRRKTTG